MAKEAMLGVFHPQTPEQGASLTPLATPRRCGTNRSGAEPPLQFVPRRPSTTRRRNCRRVVEREITLAA